MNGIRGYRKVIVASLCILSATVAVCLDKIDGAQYVGTILGTAGAYLAASHAARKNP